MKDRDVIDAWKENADPWTEAVRGKKIASRNLVTDQAIVDAVMSRSPQTVLDIGCGEGWLARELSQRGVRVTGVDVVPELIEKARELGGGDFRVMSYEEIADAKLRVPMDVAVANFSLIGAEAVDRLVHAVSNMLEPHGIFIVQTPHPVIAGGDAPYVDGWREGSWVGCGDNFKQPAPWFFRTISSWVKLIVESGLHMVELREPVHPETREPASLILIAKKQFLPV